ncbi:MAG: CDP-alcohol phosphatidyltransferase family protein [Aestuariivirga sp.]
MLDRHALDFLKPATTAVARAIHTRGISANQLSLVGFAIGVTAAILIAFEHYWLALAAIALNRTFDGLDGAVARLSTPTDRGAFLDITLDFLFYAAIPLGFAIADPASNALAAAVLLVAFIGTGTSFLAYAIIAAKRGVSSTAYPSKGFYYLGGLTEGAETILCFVLMCVWPQHFASFAYVFAALCAVTIATRLLAGWRAFKS